MDKSVRLFLVSGVKNDVGFWDIDFTDTENPLNILGKGYLECYRNHIVGYSAAIEIKLVILTTLKELLNEIISDGYKLKPPPVGITFDLSLDSVEKIFDFWFYNYNNRVLWHKFLRIIKMRSRIHNSPNYLKKALMGETLDLFLEIDSLFSYRPSSPGDYSFKKESMW